MPSPLQNPPTANSHPITPSTPTGGAPGCVCFNSWAAPTEPRANTTFLTYSPAWHRSLTSSSRRVSSYVVARASTAKLSACSSTASVTTTQRCGTASSAALAHTVPTVLRPSLSCYRRSPPPHLHLLHLHPHSPRPTQPDPVKQHSSPISSKSYSACPTSRSS